MVESSNPEEEALAPAEMLALMQAQQRSMEGRIAAFVPVLLTAWGVAWLVGLGSLWSIDGMRPGLTVPPVVALTIAVALIVGAIVLSAVLGARSGRGMRRDAATAFPAIVYGCTWSVGTVAIVVLGLGLLANGMDAALARIFFPTALVLFAGLMFVVGAAVWRAVPMLILGGWIVVVAAAAPFFGYPAVLLVLAVGGGFGFLVLAVLSFRHLARLRRPLAGARRG
ncbi:hypothetical protein [Microbacterium sp. LWH11-1.2]|uniref:hypothetical protein n=2 Tax=Bacillati TaxID=1783272 RepID=UPI00313900F7